jgi:hypothetical protein
MGTEIRLTTTRRDYLQINAVEPYGWSMSRGPVKVGGGSSTYNIKAGTKCGINQGTARQSTNYGNNSYPASNAFKNKFTHTNKGVGQWWEVQFTQEYYIDKVKILNRRDCCGNRLSGTKVYVDNQMCGTVPGGARNGQWYTVKCSEPIFGKKVRLVTVQNTYLSI